MKLISISGPCGSGKSTLIKLISLKEKFIDVVYKNCAGAKLDTTTIESKLDYTEKWFEQVEQFNSNQVKLAFSDRSPIDCIAYLKNDKEKFIELLQDSFTKLNNLKITHKQILLTSEKNILIERINKRCIELKRKKEDCENELIHLSNSLEFFNQNINLFDLIIDNSKLNPKETFDLIKEKI